MVDMFINEFRVPLSWITSPRPSSIRFSKTSIESALISGPILRDPTNVRLHGMCWHALTHIEETDCPRLSEPGGDSSLCLWDGVGIVPGGGVQDCLPEKRKRPEGIPSAKSGARRGGRRDPLPSFSLHMLASVA